MPLEICIDSPESAYEALFGEADRVEICSELSVGGLTPTIGLFDVVHRQLRGFPMPYRAMIRPRSGDFVYSNREMEVMVTDIETLYKHGARGFVFGCLKADYTVDEEKCRRLLKAANGAPCTFHRAFDWTPDWRNAMQKIASLGFDTILTSGQKPTVGEAFDTLREMAEFSVQCPVGGTATHVEVMAGSGLEEYSLTKLLADTTIRWFHSSASLSLHMATEALPPFGMGPNDMGLRKGTARGTGMVLTFLIRCATNLVSAVIPAYFTTKSLVRANQRTAQTYWCKYWAVFGAAMAVESVLDFFLISYLLPGYELIRLGFFLYAMNPVTNGAQGLFDVVIKPLHLKHERKIDGISYNVAQSVKEKARSVASNALNNVITQLPSFSQFAAAAVHLAGDAANNPRNNRASIEYNCATTVEIEEIDLLGRVVKEEPMDDYEDNNGPEYVVVDDDETPPAPPPAPSRRVTRASLSPGRNTRSSRATPVPPVADDYDKENGKYFYRNNGDSDSDYKPAKKATKGKGRGKAKKTPSNN